MSNLPTISTNVLSDVREGITLQAPKSNAWSEIATASEKIVDELQKQEVAAQAQALAERETAIESEALRIREENGDNPQSFKKAYEEFSAQFINQTPSALHGDLSIKLQKEYNKNYSPILTNFQKQNKTRAGDSLVAREQRLTSQIKESSAQGLAGSPEFNDAFEELDANIRTQANLGLIPQKVADNAINRMAHISKVETIVSKAKQSFQTGDFASVVRIQKDLNDGLLMGDMEIEERRKVADRMIADITNEAYVERLKDEQTQKMAEKEIKAEQRAVHDDLYRRIYEGKLDIDWITQNKNKLSNKDYQAGLLKVSERQAQASDPTVLSNVDVMLEQDPEEAEMFAKSEFAAGRISQDDLFDIQSEADDRKKNPIDGPERERIRIRDSLKVPKYLSSYVPQSLKLKSEAVKTFDAWLAKNQDATDDDIEKRSQAIIQKYKIDAAKVLPSPYGVGTSKAKVNDVTLGLSMENLENDFNQGKISQKELIKNMDALDAWAEFLKE